MTEETPMDQEETQPGRDVRLGKRLAYLLRYGAEKEGLAVQEGGWVDVLKLSRVPLLRYYNAKQILLEVERSTSYRGVKRFERCFKNGNIYVRAIYSRRFERNPNHNGSNVPRLLESCLTVICKKIEDYDLDGFPDEFLINTIIHKLKRQKRLSNKALRSILTSTIEHLDFSGVYLTEGTMKLLAERCPHLKVLNLHDAGYLMTDHFMEILCKKVKELESLNIASCRHLTDRTANAITKHLPNLMHLNASGVSQLSEKAIINLLLNCSQLKHLDIYDNANLSDSGKEMLIQIARERNMQIVLKDLKEEDVAPENPAAVLELWKGAIT